MLAASSAKQNAYTQNFLLWSHEKYFSRKAGLSEARIHELFPKRSFSWPSGQV